MAEERVAGRFDILSEEQDPDCEGVAQNTEERAGQQVCATPVVRHGYLRGCCG